MNINGIELVEKTQEQQAECYMAFTTLFPEHIVRGFHEIVQNEGVLGAITSFIKDFSDDKTEEAREMINVIYSAMVYISKH